MAPRPASAWCGPCPCLSPHPPLRRLCWAGKQLRSAWPAAPHALCCDCEAPELARRYLHRRPRAPGPPGARLALDSDACELACRALRPPGQLPQRLRPSGITTMTTPPPAAMIGGAPARPSRVLHTRPLLLPGIHRAWRSASTVLKPSPAQGLWMLLLGVHSPAQAVPGGQVGI